eukprot:4796860-Pyramimonas_sp.AAC.1
MGGQGPRDRTQTLSKHAAARENSPRGVQHAQDGAKTASEAPRAHPERPKRLRKRAPEGEHRQNPMENLQFYNTLVDGLGALRRSPRGSPSRPRRPKTPPR